jgi:hypothetical protein
MKLEMNASIHARWGHRVDGLIHTHAWKVGATVSGAVDCDKVFPADDLEQLLSDVVEPWRGHYLTRDDVGVCCGIANQPSRRSHVGSGTRSTRRSGRCRG